MPFANSFQIADCENLIKAILNATQTWGGAVNNKVRFEEAIIKSRIYGTLEVIKAIAKNPQHGMWGALSAKVEVNHDAFLPEHLGTHGIPLIVPFLNANERTGLQADPDEIDDYRNDTIGQFSSSLGAAIAHNAADENAMPSPVAGFWSIVNAQFKYTGYSARVPLIQITEEELGEKTPLEFLPTVVKLAPLWNLREGDNLAGIAATLVAEGRRDLAAIEAGAMSVSPVSDVMPVQKGL